MKFKIVSKDKMYVQALKRYYEKHYSDRLDLYFGDIEMDAVIICDQDMKETYNENHVLTLCDKNQVMTHKIRKYQSGKDFMEFLTSIHEADLSGHSPFRVYGFSNVVSSAGSTSLSLNLAEYLSQKGRTLWFSLEHAPSSQYYLEKKSGLSLTDVLFYLHNDPDKLKNRLSEFMKDSFSTLDQVETIYDLKQVSLDSLRNFIDILEQVGFSSVVIDFGYKTAWLEELKIHKKIMCILQNLNHYYRFQFYYKHKSTDDYCVFINRASSKGTAHENILKMVNHLYYLEEDQEVMEKKWQSKMLQHIMAKHLNLK
ncbi:hypothetical protein EZV73_09300 [Acidaminobacter sp. JC074]|uniref:hypothetical protein n=1 Tax=Acidaminobacter sp. JC074 TaxID=2530199 RepID=UPI001F0EA19C|nr:hypothetical protein [Acidaminobacter sp. JC074]MCH4887769.1 hypothetical protein [Acidaminobacter sp. JC074]